MADLEAIRDMVRSLSVQDSSSITDATLLTYINRGYSKVAGLFEWPWLEEQADLTATTPGDTLAVPDGLQAVEDIVIVDERTRIRQVSFLELRERYGDDVPDGTPAVFAIYEGNFHFAPSPGEETDYSVHYTKAPTLLVNDTDVPEWHQNFHYILVDYALAQVWKREEDYVKAREHQAEFDRTAGEMARFYLNRGTAQPIVWGERPDYGQRRRTHLNMPWLDGV